MVVANPTGTKVFGIANDKSDVSGYDLLIFWTGGKRTVQSSSVNFSSHIGQWSALETWPEESYSHLLVGGELDGAGVVGFLSFDEKLQPALFQKISDHPVTCLSRILGSSSLLVGTTGKLLEFKVTKKAFTPGRVFKLAPDIDLIDVKIRQDKMFGLDSHGNVFVRKTSKRFDANLALQKENSLSSDSNSASPQKARPTFNVSGLAAVSKFGAKLTGALQSRNLDKSSVSTVEPDTPSLMGDKGQGSSMMESVASSMVRRDLLFSNEAQLKASLSQGQTMKISLSEVNNQANRILCSVSDLMIAGPNRVAEFGRDGQGPYSFVREVINKPVHSMSTEKGGDLVLQTLDNNLVVWSRITGKTIKTITGNKSDAKLADHFVVKQPAEAIENVLWYKGDGSFALLDSTKDYQQKDLNDFCQDDDQNSIDPIMAILISKPLKVIVLLHGEEFDFWIKYYDPSKEKEKAYALKCISDKDKKKSIESMVSATVLEESGRTNVFYLAGKGKMSAGPDKGKTILLVCAIKFASPNLELQDYYAFDKRPEFKTIGALKAISAPNKIDYLLVGTEQVVSVLKVNKDVTFSFVHQFANIHSDLVTDIDLFGTSLHSLSPSDSFMSVVTLPNNAKETAVTSEKRKIVEFTDPVVSSIQLPPMTKFCRLALAADGSCLIASATNGGLFCVTGIKKSKYVVSATSVPVKDSPRAVFMRNLADGSTLVHYQSSSDLVSYDHEWKELSRFNGIQSQKSDKTNKIAQLKKISYTPEQKYMLFFKGETTLMKLRLESYELEEMDSFFTPPNKPINEIQSVGAVGDSDGSNLAGLCYASGSPYICVKEAGEAVKFYEAKIRMPQICSAACLNVSNDGKALIIGGSSDPNFGGYGILAAYTFDKKLKSISLQLYKDSHHKCVSRISKVRESSKFVVGMTSTFLIVDFPNNEKFVTMCVTKNVISSKF